MSCRRILNRLSMADQHAGMVRIIVYLGGRHMQNELKLEIMCIQPNQMGEQDRMDLRQLTIFLSITAHGSFTDAAKALYISQPTVSMHISALEEELGTALFERQSRGVTLTGAGAILKRYAEDMLMLRDRAQAEMDQYKTDVSGPVRVLASSAPADYVLPAVIADFITMHPQVFVKMTRADSTWVWDAIRNYEAELGIVGNLGDGNDIDVAPIARDRLVLITPACEPYLGWTDPISPTAMAKLPMISRESSSGTRRTLEQAMIRAGLHPDALNLRASLDSTEAIKAAVQCGAGVGVVSELSVRDDVAAGRLLEFNVSGLDLTRSFYVISHAKRVLSPAATALRRHVLESLDPNSRAKGLTEDNLPLFD